MIKANIGDSENYDDIIMNEQEEILIKISSLSYVYKTDSSTTTLPTKVLKKESKNFSSLLIFLPMMFLGMNLCFSF